MGKNCQNKKLNSTIFNSSTILTHEKSFDLLNLLGLNKTSYQLLYRSSTDGLDSKTFHSKCNGVQGTLTVIKTKNSNIFGGYTSADWSGDSQYKSDSTAFLFSLVNSYNVPVKMNVTQSNMAIYCYSGYSFVFGGGSGRDLSCYIDQCYSNLGNSYQLPSFLTYGTNEANSFLGGSLNFEPVEIEIYLTTY